MFGSIRQKYSHFPAKFIFLIVFTKVKVIQEVAEVAIFQSNESSDYWVAADYYNFIRRAKSMLKKEHFHQIGLRYSCCHLLFLDSQKSLLKVLISCSLWTPSSIYNGIWLIDFNLIMKPDLWYFRFNHAFRMEN